MTHYHVTLADEEESTTYASLDRAQGDGAYALGWTPTTPWTATASGRWDRTFLDEAGKDVGARIEACEEDCEIVIDWEP